MNEVLPAVLVASTSAAFASAAVAFRVDASVAMRAGLSSGRSGPWARRVPRGPAGRIGRAAWLRRVSRPALLAERLTAAGWSASVEEAIGAKAFLAGAAGLAALAGPPPAPLLAPVLSLASFRVPDVVLAAAARRRMAEADREIPQLLDLLAAASSAGLSGPMALRRAVEATEGPLSEELCAVVRAVDLGGRWRDELRRVVDRLGLPDLRRAVSAMARTESLGTSLSDSMTELAAQVREARRASATERARKAPVKMLFPLVFLVLPAFLLLTVVPVLLTTLQSIR